MFSPVPGALSARETAQAPFGGRPFRLPLDFACAGKRTYEDRNLYLCSSIVQYEQRTGRTEKALVPLCRSGGKSCNYELIREIPRAYKPRMRI